jgi:hypothetical protein
MLMANRLATPADFPSEFDSVDSRDIRAALEEAEAYVGDAWGEKRSTGHWLKAAAILASKPSTRGLITGLSSGGEVIEEEVGPVRVKYAPLSSGGASGGQANSYAERFEALQRTIFVGPSLTL